MFEKNSNIEKITCLDNWIDGDMGFPFLDTTKLDRKTIVIPIELEMYNGIELYEVLDYKYLSSDESMKNIKEYKNKVMKIFKSFGKDYRKPIKDINIRSLIEKLQKPYESTSIYMITVKEVVKNEKGLDNENERVVYIGQAKSKVNRFENGHKVAIKLHSPEYKKYDKYIYFCTPRINFFDKFDENNINENLKNGFCPIIPIEWVDSKKFVKEIVDSIEHKLISGLDPELSIESPKLKWEVDIRIQSDYGFLDGARY